MKKLFWLILAMLCVAIPVFAEAAEAPAPEPAVMVDLTQIIVSIIGLLLSALFTWLIKAVVPPLKKWLEVRTTAQQREMLTKLTRQLVQAAEQTIGAGHGGEKLKYVCDQLKQRGYVIDMDVIEASVMELNDGFLADLVSEPETTGTENPE